MGRVKKTKEQLVAFDFENAQENIVAVNVAEQSEEWMKVGGANKNLLRYLISLTDGLKPVQRRLLYMMYINGYFKKHFIKLSIAATSTVEIHPHGDANLADVAVGMAVEWKNNAPLISILANKGSENGSDAAQARYLDAAISEFAYDCYFSQFEESNVDMIPSYNHARKEPEYLPAKYPVAIINGGFSEVGYGVASNVPPFNFKEVCETTIALMKNPNAKVCIAPDSPTGADIIMSKKSVVELFETGDSKLQMRAVPEIDYINNTITFTAVPIQVSTSMVTEAISKLRVEGKLNEILEINDHTSELNGVFYEIVLRREANPEEVLGKLFKLKTNLVKGYAAKLNMIDDYHLDLYSVRGFILAWIEYRRDTVRSSFNGQLISLEEDKHMNDVLIYITQGSRGVRTVQMSTESKNKEDFASKLMAEYKITSLQAATISRMSISAFNEDACMGYLQRRDELQRKISEIRRVLGSDGEIDNVIETELREGIEKYGEARRSRIISPDTKVVDDMDVVIGISEDGYIKKIKADKPNIGVIGKQSGVMSMAIPANNTDSLFVFDELGMMHTISISSLPVSSPKQGGFPIERYSKLSRGTKIVHVTKVPKAVDLRDSDHGIVLATKNGFVKRIDTSAMISGKKSLSPSMRVMALIDGDSLSAVTSFDGAELDVIVYTNHGDGVRISLADIPTQLPSSRGTRVMKLRSTEAVVGISPVNDGTKYILYVTSSGKVKKTDLNMFPTMRRGEEPLPLVNMEQGESLVTILSITGNERLKFYKKLSDPETIDAVAIPLTTRIAKATKMLKTPKGDSIVSVARL